MDESDGLTAVAGQLVEEVQGLSRRFRFLRRLAIGLAISFVMDLTITTVLAVVANDQWELNHKLRQALTQNYTTSQQQLQTRVEFLCPLYQLLIGLADDPARRAELTPAQKIETDIASAALHKQYAKLKCPPIGS